MSVKCYALESTKNPTWGVNDDQHHKDIPTSLKNDKKWPKHDNK